MVVHDRTPAIGAHSLVDLRDAMATFEKRPGAPSGTLTVTTAHSTYSFTDGGTVVEADARRSIELRAHPYLREVPGTELIYVPGPEYSDARYNTAHGNLVDVTGAILSPKDPTDRAESLRAAHDKQASFALTQKAADELTWNDQLANLSAPWTTANTPTVSGGQIAGNVSGALSVALRPIVFNDRFRFVVPLNFKDGLAAGRFASVVVTTSPASTIAAGTMTNSVALSIDASTGNNRAVVVNAFGLVRVLGNLPAGNKQYVVTFTWDDVRGLGFAMRSTDATFETAEYIANSVMTGGSWKPTAAGVAVADTRGATGTTLGPVGFRASHATITPRTGVEGLAPTTTFGGKTPPPNSERSRVAVPANYDSRVPSPLVIACHGGGSDVWHGGQLGEHLLTSGCIVASGDFRSNGSNYASSGASPVHYWPLEEASGSVSSYNSGAVGAVGSGATYRAGGSTGGPLADTPSYALGLDGTANGWGIQTTTGTLDALATTAATFECWVYVTNPTAGVLNIFSAGNFAPGGVAGSNTHISLRMNSTGNVVGELVFNNAALRASTNATVLSANTWYHVVLSHHPTNGTICYVNGVAGPNQTGSVASMPSLTALSGGSRVMVGAPWTNTAPATGGITGRVAHAGFYSGYAMTAAQAQLHYMIGKKGTA